MADIEPAFDFVMALEGGGELHTVEGDPGGTTKWGVSQRAHPEVDIASLTRIEALDIFRDDYWGPLLADEIESQEIAEELVEMAFNAGRPAAVQIAQQATNDVRERAGFHGERIVVDGRMGPQTLGGLNSIYAMGRVAEMAWDGRFNLRQLDFYRGLKPNLVDRFFVGWSRRVA